MRGIYSTALIKLLIDEGFKIVRPTRSQIERFNVPESASEPDAQITDSADRHFAEIKGLGEVVEQVTKAVRKNIEDSIIVWRRPGDAAHVLVGFPVDAKRRLDALRSQVAYTVPWHHYCRAGGEALSSMVSFAEDLVERGLVPPDEMDRMFEEQVRQLTPRLGAMVRIIHVKLNGGRVVMGPGKVVWRDGDSIRILRRIMGTGVYDGLGVPKQLGDYAVTEAKRLETWTKTTYYSMSGTLKGAYYNVCTPVAFYPDQIHYFDLEVDVVLVPNQGSKVVDEDLLRKALDEGVLSGSLFEKAMRTVEAIRVGCG